MENVILDTSVLESLVQNNGLTLERIEQLLSQNVELLLRMYSLQLWLIGVSGAVFVLLVLYHFMRKFF